MTIAEYLCTFSLLASLFSGPCSIIEGEKVVANAPKAHVSEEHKKAYQNIPIKCLQYEQEISLYLEDKWHRKYKPMIMAQMLQESACVPSARSHAGAAGLFQIMPATAKDIADRINKTIGRPDVYNPIWSIRAGISYQRNMFISIRNAENLCEQYAMALSGYNGGLGWVYRDRKITERQNGNQNKWFGKHNVSHWSDRAMWAFKENRGYVQRIIHELQPRFYSAGFSGVPICIES